MKTWVKIENGKIKKYLHGKYIINENTNMIYSNPTEDNLKECGYRILLQIPKEVRYLEKDGFYIDTIFEDDGTYAIPRQQYIPIMTG